MGLSNVSGAVDLLAEQGHEINPVFVTVDPERDTPEVLREYLIAFHERLEGLTGKGERIRKLASAFLAFYEISAETKDSEYYLIDHTSYVYLVDKEGELLGYFPDSIGPEELANAILEDFSGHLGG